MFLKRVKMALKRKCKECSRNVIPKRIKGHYKFGNVPNVVICGNEGAGLRPCSLFFILFSIGVDNYSPIYIAL